MLLRPGADSPATAGRSDTMEPMASTINYRALLAPVSRNEVRQFRRQARAAGQPWARRQPARMALIIVFAAVALVLVINLSVFLLPRLLGVQQNTAPLPGLSGVVPFLIMGVLAVVAVRTVGGSRRGGDRWERLFRRTRFASDNGLVYTEAGPLPQYPGLIFSLGSARRTFHTVHRSAAPTLDIGSYQYTTGSGRNTRTHTWGYLAMRLERRLPHMLLDARGNNSILGGSTFPVAFRRDQRLSLEGDFDKYFTLYCPSEYARDALYVFTPDLMASLIEESSAYDLEIVDDWMFLYSRSAIDIDDPATLARLFRISETVGAKTLRQTQLYSDDRVGNRSVNVVAAPGQRLKKSNTLVVVGAALLIGWFFIGAVRPLLF